jgi:hypothetical protein
MLLASVVIGVDIFWRSQVDKHIRRLDSDLARFEAELKEKALDTNVESEYHNGY